MNKKIEIINLTPHEINVVNDEMKEIMTIPPSGIVARCSEIKEEIGTINGVPLIKIKLGEVEDLPNPKEGVRYIVSRLVMQAIPERDDLLSPGEVVRNDKGVIVGCKSLAL